MTLQSSHTSSNNSDGDTTTYRTLINELKVLNADNWPDQPVNSDTLDRLYGEEEVSSLAQRFRVDERSSLRAFREYKDAGGKRVPDELKHLLTAVDTTPLCTAECERGYSQMNLIITPARNSLAVSTVSELLFCKLVGPPLPLFKPKQYVQSWLAKGKHLADDVNSKIRNQPGNDNANEYKPNCCKLA